MSYFFIYCLNYNECYLEGQLFEPYRPDDGALLTKLVIIKFTRCHKPRLGRRGLRRQQWGCEIRSPVVGGGHRVPEHCYLQLLFTVTGEAKYHLYHQQSKCISQQELKQIRVLSFLSTITERASSQYPKYYIQSNYIYFVDNFDYFETQNKASIYYMTPNFPRKNHNLDTQGLQSCLFTIIF